MIGNKVQTRSRTNYEHSFCLHIPATNNVAEYETVLHVLKMVHSLGTTNVTLLTDSQLVAYLASKEFMAKEPQIARYAEVLKEQSKQLEHIRIGQIPWTENNSTDTLAKLASAWDGGPHEIFVDSQLTIKDVLEVAS